MPILDQSPQSYFGYEYRMGQEISQNDFDPNDKKFGQLRNKKWDLGDSLKGVKTVQGEMVARTDSFTSVSDINNPESLLAGIIAMLGQKQQAAYIKSYKTIAIQLSSLLANAKNSSTFVQTSRTYPLMTRHGFVMVYSYLYLEQARLKKGGSTLQQIVLITALKMIKPDSPPQTQMELGQYLVASTISSEQERQKVLDELWFLIIETWPIDKLNKELQRLKLLKQMRAGQN